MKEKTDLPRMTNTRWINHTGDCFWASCVEGTSDNPPRFYIRATEDQHPSVGDVVEELPSYQIHPTYRVIAMSSFDTRVTIIELEPFFQEFVIFWKLTDKFGNEIEDSGILEATSEDNATVTARSCLRHEYHPIDIEYICVNGGKHQEHVFGEIHYDRFIRWYDNCGTLSQIGGTDLR